MGGRALRTDRDERGEREAREGTTLLLTGRPGVGKTTAVRRAVERLAGEVGIRGFYTEEVREGGRRVGFRGAPFGRGSRPREGATKGPGVTAETSGGRLIAHVDFGPPRVSRYGVDVGAVDALTRATLEQGDAGVLHVVDEIGKMECFSDRFVAAIRRLLDEGRPLFGTVSERGGGFMREVRERPGTTLWEVTRQNRGELPGRAAAWLRSLAGR